MNSDSHHASEIALVDAATSKPFPVAAPASVFEERASGLILLRAHPRLDPIRKDPRYPPLVRQLGLESATA